MEFGDCIVYENSAELEFFSPDQQPETPVPKKRKKPSVICSWTYTAIQELIQAVEQHPCVWQYSSTEYKDRNKREQAWREIEKMCTGHTVEDCKAKWCNIKTAFQNVKKKLKSKSGQGAENTIPHWPHWSAMQFYNDHSVSKMSSTVSTLDLDDSGSTSQHAAAEIVKVDKSDILQRAVKCLDAEEDNWHAIGMYLASQMREIAKKNKKAANKLHFQLVKVVMDAALEAEEDN
ncbi:uncharacterized protein LOC109613149 [Musca domestica]|uniref:Uncharacterized protein LOC101888067 n=1 Tax=Musca domestica TaxID=7370 RepID=A0A9J7DH72_MUSDO|nr:uncharacterized protein LOC101888067 [Musca domestica]XP_019892886.2 uncharacterized protein LOC109612867 [Musca domestica]XP_058987353.1 uncharacterized protein LOC109613149 [Musca domestica]